MTPQLARLSDQPPTGRDWVHEIKFDGYRTLVRKERGKLRLLTRSGLDWTAKYGSLTSRLGQVKADSFVIDGEVAVVDGKGRTDFQALQLALTEERSDVLLYYAFDLLELNGKDLRHLPLLDRKKKLKNLIARANTDRVIYSEHHVGSAAALRGEACAAGLEGIISKRADAPYVEGRSDLWLKSKCGHEQEFVIVGYTDPQGSRQKFGALLLAAREGTTLRFVGRVGTGFDDASLRKLHAQFQKLRQPTPALNVPRSERYSNWLKPKLVAQIRFGGWTRDDHLRHPVFHGLREDKSWREVKIERAAKADKDHIINKPKNQTTNLSHPDRVVAKGVTKKQLDEYYAAAAKRMLPYIETRPVSVLRCPTLDKCFIQKHLPGQPTLMVSSKTDLHQFVQLGVVEFHVHGANTDDLKHPNLIVFDLDPAPGVKWEQVMHGAFSIKETLDHLKLRSFVKTTGGKGLHLHVPIVPEYSWDQIKAFAKTVVTELADREPGLFLTKMNKAARKGKIFLDYFRNDEGATAVAPYSVRARAGGPIAMPLEWDDITTELRPDHFQLRDGIPIFKPVWKGARRGQRIKLLDR